MLKKEEAGNCTRSKSEGIKLRNPETYQALNVDKKEFLAIRAIKTLYKRTTDGLQTSRVKKFGPVPKIFSQA